MRSCTCTHQGPAPNSLPSAQRTMERRMSMQCSAVLNATYCCKHCARNLLCHRYIVWAHDPDDTLISACVKVFRVFFLYFFSTLLRFAQIAWESSIARVKNLRFIVILGMDFSDLVFKLISILIIPIRFLWE